MVRRPHTWSRPGPARCEAENGAPSAARVPAAAVAVGTNGAAPYYADGPSDARLGAQHIIEYEQRSGRSGSVAQLA